MKLRKPILFVLIALLASPGNAYPYGTTTHAAISINAFGAAPNIKTNFFSALKIDPQASFGLHTARGWIIAGSQFEDDLPLPVTFAAPIPSARPLFHFFDPYNNKGLTVTPAFQTSTSMQWGIFGFGQGLLAGVPWSANNDFPYNSNAPTPGARRHYYNGLTMSSLIARNTELGMMFRSLGQVIHLLQDTAQPQHVRNDAHLDLGATRYAAFPIQRPSVYERYVDANPGLQSLPGTGLPVAFPLPTQFFEDGSGSGLAEFANRNFVSAGTNCTNATSCNSAGGYPFPNITAESSGKVVDMVYGGNLPQCHIAFPASVCQSFISLFANQFPDPLTGAIIQNSRMTTRSMFDFDLMNLGLPPFFSLASFNYASQAQILIPKAVDYSAGLLNYFFRGSLTAQAVGTGRIAITNKSNEGMNGTFTLYYDDANGTRYPVQGATWQLTISPGGTSASQTFTPPTNPPPQTAGQYILVFQGIQGSEPGAVTGAVVNLDSPLSGSLNISSIDCTRQGPATLPFNPNFVVGQRYRLTLTGTASVSSTTPERIALIAQSNGSFLISQTIDTQTFIFSFLLPSTSCGSWSLQGNQVPFACLTTSSLTTSTNWVYDVTLVYTNSETLTSVTTDLFTINADGSYGQSLVGRSQVTLPPCH